MIVGANNTISIYKLDKSSTTDTYPGTADYTGIAAYIESQGAEISQALDQSINIETFYMHTEPIDIHVGDKVIDDKSVEYRVAGVERHENNPDTSDLYTTTLHKQHNPET